MKKLPFILICILLYGGGVLVGLSSIPQIVSRSPFFVVNQMQQFRACEFSSVRSTYISSDKEQCYIKTLVSMVKRFGVRNAIDVFRMYVATPEGVFLTGQRCHALAHEVGNTAVRQGVSPHTLLTECKGMCDTSISFQTVGGLDLGCLNGAGHSWVLLDATVLEVAKNCLDPDVDTDAQDGCFHGIGHGLTEKYNGIIPLAIDECRTLPLSRARFQCAHAIFMEKQSKLVKGNEMIDPYLYCLTLPPEMATSCFEFAGYISYSQTKNVSVALNHCRNAPADTKRLCLERVGESLYEERFAQEDVSDCFGSVDTDSAHRCLYGYIRASIDHINDAYGTFALASCTKLPKDQQREQCYLYAGQVMSVRYGKDKWATACGTIPEERFRLLCLQGETP